LKLMVKQPWWLTGRRSALTRQGVESQATRQAAVKNRGSMNEA